MLFFQYSFLGGFFPLCYAGYVYVLNNKPTKLVTWLALSSVIFYSVWDYSNLFPLFFSIITNYIFGKLIVNYESRAYKKSLLIVALIFNVGLLSYYKYFDFFIDAIGANGFMTVDSLKTSIPLGISFFTFTQIAFLVDSYQGKCSAYRFIDYVLFVTYFPHLIAGPIIHHKEMMPQFKSISFKWENIALGLGIFIIGMIKKVIIADYFIDGVRAIFDQPNQSVSFVDAWFATLSYSVQIYFDFSGYSDMAIGLSKMLGIRLPINFNSPYKATSIIDFWKRWHITLSRFLKEYIYIPLGGNRKGEFRKYLNILLTMFVGGIWHGAGFTFILWGVMHGLLIVVNHIIVKLSFGYSFRFKSNNMWLEVKKIITFITVSLLWVPFRSNDLNQTFSIWKGCFGFNGLTFPEVWAHKLGGIAGCLKTIGFSFNSQVPVFSFYSMGGLLAALLIALYAPNVFQIYGNCRNKIALIEAYAKIDKFKINYLLWKPTKYYASCYSILAILAVWCRYDTSEFLYFQF